MTTQMSRLWSVWFLEQVFHQWWFEPAMASLAFAGFINWYWYHERRLGLSSENNNNNNVVGTNDVVFHTTTTSQPQQSTIMRYGTWCLSCLKHGHWTELMESLGPRLQSFVAYWVGIYIWISIVPPAAAHIPDGVPSNVSDLVYLLLEIVSGIVLYDAIFFALHWSMHEIPALRRYHARHHEQAYNNNNNYKQLQKNLFPLNNNNNTKVARAVPLDSRTVLRHSLTDGALQVLVNILVQRYTLWGCVKTRLARAIHNIVVIWMLTESHSAAPEPWIWRSWCVGVREHYQHHTSSSMMYHRYPPFPMKLNKDTKVQDSSMGIDSCKDQTINIPTNMYYPHSSSRRCRCRYQQFFGYLDDWRIRRHDDRKRLG